MMMRVLRVEVGMLVRTLCHTSDCRVACDFFVYDAESVDIGLFEEF